MVHKEPMKVRDLLRRAVPYEQMAPLALPLQQAIVVGGVCTAAAIPLVLFFTPVLRTWAFAGFFWFWGDLTAAPLALLRTPVGLACNGAALVGYGALLYRTRGLRADVRVHLAWHRFALGLVAVGALNLLILGLPVLGVVVNALIWLLAIVLAVGLAIAILFVLAAGSRR